MKASYHYQGCISCLECLRRRQGHQGGALQYLQGPLRPAKLIITGQGTQPLALSLHHLTRTLTMRNVHHTFYDDNLLIDLRYLVAAETWEDPDDDTAFGLGAILTSGVRPSV